MARGKFRIYLGAAPGVGKTFAMLNEGWRRHERGSADVVIGYVECHGRPLTEAQIRELEVVQRKKLVYRDREFEEMDVDAVLARKPDVALVDELAHTNVPGSRNEKRWQDVEELLDAGIEVITTLNIQHLESMNDVVERITGVRQQETIPDAIVRQADQIELVDMSAETLRRRMAHGNIYPPEKVDTALANYFRVGNLDALRELALLWVADRVDSELESYRDAHGITRPWETRERVLVAITGAPGGETVIRRAARMAVRTKGDLMGVYVRPADGLAAPAAERLNAQRRLLVELGGEYHELVGEDIAGALVQFANAENATQIVLGASQRSRWTELISGSVINRVLRASGPIDVHVISSEEPEPPTAVVDRVPHRLSPLPPRRRLPAMLLAVAGPFLVTLILTNLRDTFTRPSDLLFFLLLVVGVAALGGLVPAAVTAVLSFALANYYFTTPLYTFRIAKTDDLIALIAFLISAAVVGAIVSGAARRRLEASRARAEAETLASLSGKLVASEDPLAAIMEQLREVFRADAVAVLHQQDGEERWKVEASSGARIPHRPEDATLALKLRPDQVLVVTGSNLGAEELTILRTFASQVATAIEQRRLRVVAAHSDTLAETDRLRSALLAAVSHDLRSPLASIKASISSLLQEDVDWTPDAEREFHETIDQETDRLNALVGNLLDMSRLQAGALQLVIGPVGLNEVVSSALTTLSRPNGKVDVDVPETLPDVRADAALLERAVANLVDNALKSSPTDRAVRIEAGKVNDHVDLRIIDRGPGIPVKKRDAVFQPFQRFDDHGDGTGVGLGLALARGFVEAMDGELLLEDTPGGGVTMVISLPVTQ